MGQSKRQYEELIQEEMIAQITAIQGSGDFTNDYGHFYKFEYTFNDGVTLQANHKTPESPFKVGDEVEYEVKRDDPKFGKSGKVGKPNTHLGGTTPYKTNGSTSVPNGNKDRIIARQSSLKVAMDYLHQRGYESQDKVDQLQELCNVAEFITDYVLSDSDGTPAPKNRPDYQGKGEIPRHPQAPQEPLPNPHPADRHYDASEEKDLAREQATAHLADDLPF